MSSSQIRLHVVALKAFGLGAALVASLLVLLWKLDANSAVPRICLYVTMTSIFHMMEFLSTAMFNAEQADDDSFILGDSDLHLVYFVSTIETLVTHSYLSYNRIALFVGLAVALVGQFCRTLAMYTAGVSFNHYVQKEHSEKHKLVTWGIYRYLRHPSYFGFFWWFVGSQILLQNGVTLVAGAYKLHSFFRLRIEYEEALLHSFFPDYKEYKRSTTVGIPGIQ